MPTPMSYQSEGLRIERLRSKMRSKNWSRCSADTRPALCSASMAMTSSCDFRLCSLSRVAVRSARALATAASSLSPVAGGAPSEAIC